MSTQCVPDRPRGLLVVALLVSGLAIPSGLSCASPQPVVAAAPTSPPAPPPPDEPSPGFRLPGDTRPLDYSVTLDVDPEKESFSGQARIRVQLDAPRRTIWLHARHLDVKTAMVAGRRARFTQVDDDGMARLALDAPVGPGPIDVELSWTARFNPALESLYRVKYEDAWYAFTQFEAISARDAMPCFDEPRFKTQWSLAFTTKKGDVVVANTKESARVELQDGRVQTRFEPTEPLPTYLVAFAVGPLDVVEGKQLPPVNGRPEPLQVRGVAARGKGKLLASSLDVTAEVLDALERWFGIPYPYTKLDIVAVPDFAAGAMENAGIVTFRDVLLFVDKNSPLGLQKGNIEVITHELAHQWFGNYVTLAWWDDIWLNEAFASWLPTEILEKLRPTFRARTGARTDLDDVTGQDSLVSARQIREPVDSKGDIENAFDGITYGKGAAVIAMFERWVGPEIFQKGVREYLQTHAHGVGTSRELMASLSTAAGRDVATPFSTFLEQPGVPFVSVRLVCGGAKDNAAKTMPPKSAAALELSQERFLPLGSSGDRKKIWQIPVCARYDDGGKLKTSCTLLTEATGTLPLEAKSCPRVVHPNADGAGYYRWSLPPAQLKTLAGALGKMSPGERISFGNAIRGALSSGAVPYRDALDASLFLARDEEPSIARTPLGLLLFAHDELVDEAARPRVAKKMIELYRPVLEKLKFEPKPGEEPLTRERRSLALSALATHAEEPKTLAELGRWGRIMLGLDEGGDKKIHLDKIPPDLMMFALPAAVRQGGAATWDDVQARLGTETDPLTRTLLLAALGSSTEPALAARARDLALDQRLRTNEVFVPLQGQGSDVRTRDALWTWMGTNYDALLARLPETWGDAAIAGGSSGFCSEEKAAEVESFFQSRPKKSDALGRALAQAVEEIRLCAAKKAFHQESARKLFSK